MRFFLGLMIFFSGLEGSKRNLQKLTSPAAKQALEKLTPGIIYGVALGAIITAVFQSSSAVSIIIISLLSVNMIDFKTALALLMGANIGTTLTVQLISLPILSLYPYFLAVGIILIISGFRAVIFKNPGLVIFFFGLVFWGLEIMANYFSRTGTSTLLTLLLTRCEQNTLYGILLGALVTALVQSSSVVTGITVTLARSDFITLSGAVAVALGSNIGTCITAFLAAINGGEEARDLARGHFILNMSGVFLFLIFFSSFVSLIKLTDSRVTRQIANAHTIFNLITIIIYLPFFDTFVSFLRGNKKR